VIAAMASFPSAPLSPADVRRWERLLLGSEMDAPAGLVEGLVERVQRAWPDLGVELDSFFEHVADRLSSGPSSTEVPMWDRLCAEDLYLAFACAGGNARALRAFEQEVRPELAAALARLRVPAERHDDVRQELWHKLCIAGDRPKILDYSGRGKLRYWFKVTVMRLLIDERRRQAPEAVPLDRGSGEFMAPAADPEIEYLKRLYSHEFRSALEESAEALTPDVRNVLRSYYCYQMTVDQIAAAYGLHRATAARRVQRAREVLLADTRRRMIERLRIQTADLESVLRLIESRLHLSLHRLLAK
jgi:RNA polymerase sigma-70 factor, ECF subfamily